MEIDFGKIELNQYESEVCAKGIIASFEKEIKKLEKEIVAIDNDPNNEGQATYSSEKSERYGNIQILRKNIDTLKTRFKIK